MFNKSWFCVICNHQDLMLVFETKLAPSCTHAASLFQSNKTLAKNRAEKQHIQSHLKDTWQHSANCYLPTALLCAFKYLHDPQNIQHAYTLHEGKLFTVILLPQRLNAEPDPGQTKG